MFFDAPGYGLSDLSAGASRVELRLYVGEQDNVHLPSFAWQIAAARTGAQLAQPRHEHSQVAAANLDRDAAVFRKMHSQAHCSIWMAAGAGRVACMLYFKEALENLLPAPQHRPAASCPC